MCYGIPQQSGSVSPPIVCDFESFLSPVHNDNDDAADVDVVKATNLIDEHRVCGFACYRVSEYPQYQTDPVVYSGPDVMDKFYEHIMRESQEISSILANDLDMTPLTDGEQTYYDAATVCGECGVAFTAANHKVRHHDHVSGQYLFPACNNCNLTLKMPNRKRKVTQGHKANKKVKLDEQQDNKFFLPLVFHNLRSYDSHFVIKHFKKQYTARPKTTTDHDENIHNDIDIDVDETADDSEEIQMSYGDIRVTPLNGEKYLSFRVGNLRFIDSFQFLSTSLENLVSLLLKSGRDKFAHTIKHLGNHDSVFAKGVYPYSYMTGPEKFGETQLPPIEAFHNTLNDEALSREDYDRAKQIWAHYNMKTLQNYHDHYLLSDVLLLADVFQNFRNTIFEEHRLDPLHFITLPSLAWASAMKYTHAKLDLITDPDMYLMIENNMRGGIATISHRHAQANNPQVEGYDPSKPTSFITYLDANNLYGMAMSEPLPVGNFRFLSDQEISDFDLNSIPPDSDTGYIIECDLTYPQHLHNLHNDYPLAPEHLTVSPDMLSNSCNNIKAPNWKPTQKLVPNLQNKTKYVCHYRNLQFYIKHGLILTKIHRIISFYQSPWLKPWIDYCTERRKMARNEFESDLAKLQANATFGKTMEQVRNRVNVRLICDPIKLAKAVSRPTFRRAEIINDDLTMVRGARQRVTLNKPISAGFTILEISKLVMYRFYYDYLKPKYGNKCTLLFTDTDSFCCHIETQDLHQDMSQNLDLFDTSNFDKDNPLYTTKNHRVLGKFKSETGSLAPREFVGLRAKMYSLDVPTNPKESKIRVKGVKKSYIKRKVRHKQFLNVLKTLKSTTSTFRTFLSTNHVLRTVEINKACLNAFDDKRFILDDGVTTLAYGHKDITHSA